MSFSIKDLILAIINERPHQLELREGPFFNDIIISIGMYKNRGHARTSFVDSIIDFLNPEENIIECHIYDRNAISVISTQQLINQLALTNNKNGSVKTWDNGSTIIHFNLTDQEQLTKLTKMVKGKCAKYPNIPQAIRIEYYEKNNL